MRKILSIHPAGSPRPGTVYVAVLGVSLIVAVISIAAIHVTRIELREQSAVEEMARARLMAESGIEYAICKIKSNPLWRADYTSGVTNTLSDAISSLTGTGRFSFTLSDPDGDLNDDNQDSVILRSTGTAGNATNLLEVMLQPTGVGVSSLEASLHSEGPMSVQTQLTTDQAVSANADITISGSGNLSGNAWSTGTISGSVSGSTSQNQSPPRVMPDPTIVFEYYTSNGTPIDMSSIGSRIELCVLSPGTNPYGTQIKNFQGIYVIDCQGGSLSIRNCRIEGTLVVLNAAGGVKLEGSIHWNSVIANFPALMVQGPVQMDWDRNVALSESNLGINFNPVGAPDNGVTDNDTNDTYPGQVKGLLYIDGDLNITRQAKFIGIVVATGTVQVNSSANLSYLSNAYDNAPPGFAAGTDMRIVPGTWKRVAY